MNLIVPESVRRKAGIRAGDKIEFKASPRKITILAKAVEEHTPAERRKIDARLAKARRGPYHGPFDTVEEALSFLKQEIAKRKKRRKTAGK